MNILITGSTGFLGKVVLMDLLRRKNISKIYLLIRSKKGECAKTRYENLISNKFIKDYFINTNKINIIEGDILLKNLGIGTTKSIPRQYKKAVEE